MVEEKNKTTFLFLSSVCLSFLYIVHCKFSSVEGFVSSVLCLRPILAPRLLGKFAKLS